MTLVKRDINFYHSLLMKKCYTLPLVNQIFYSISLPFCIKELTFG